MRMTNFGLFTLLIGVTAMLGPIAAQAQQRDDRDRSGPRNINEDEWYDPTDWFDGNNIESDDIYDDEAGQQSRRSQQNRSSRNDGTQRRYSSDASQRDSMGQTGQAYIARYDQDNDNQLSRNELPRNMRETFEQLDRNNDNQLTSRELQQHARGQRNQVQPVHIAYIWITSANQGQMSLNDVQQAYELLQQIDNDGNGQISRRELRARRQEIVSNWVDSAFRRHDENDNGQISRDEANATAMAERFEQLDRNGDDRVSRNELQRTLEENLRGPGSNQGQDQSQQRSNSDQGQSQQQQPDRNDNSSQRQQNNRNR